MASTTNNTIQTPAIQTPAVPTANPQSSPVIVVNTSHDPEGVDTQLYTLMIVGGTLQALSFVATIALIALACIVNPYYALGIIVTVAFAALGIALSQSERYIDGSIIIPCLTSVPYIPGQPVGIYREGHNCWANATMQLCLQSESIREALRSMPQAHPFHRFYTNYCLAQDNQQVTAADANSQEIRAVLNDRNVNNISDQSNISEDANEALGYILEVLQEDFELRQAQNDQLPLPAFLNPMRLVQTNIEKNTITPSLVAYPQITLNLQNYLEYCIQQRNGAQGAPPATIAPSEQALFINYLLDPYFNDQNDVGPLHRRFQTAPNELIFHFARFRNDGTKITNAVPVPMQFTLPADYIEQNGQETHLELDSFIMHNGTQLNAHYISYIKAEDGLWWCLNDGHARPVQDLRAVANLASRSYMVHYRAVQPTH